MGLRASTPCPACGVRNVVDVTRVMTVNPDPAYSLAGVQTKFAATDGWRYDCSNCGDSGPASPK